LDRSITHAILRVELNMELAGVAYALSAAALFGAGTPAAKVLLRDLSPLMLSALSYIWEPRLHCWRTAF